MSAAAGRGAERRIDERASAAENACRWLVVALSVCDEEQTIVERCEDLGVNIADEEANFGFNNERFEGIVRDIFCCLYGLI